MNSLPCKGILFDMDGTLLDSDEASEHIWQIWAKMHQVDMEKIRAVHHGRRPEETIAIVAPELNALQTAQFIYDEQEKAVEGIRPITGAKAFYDSLPDGTFGIVTAATQKILEHRFRLVGLKPPKVCITAKLLKKGKPDPEGYLMGARLLGLSPHDCVVFEDAPAGLLAAKRAGMRSVALTTSYPGTKLREAMGEDYEASRAIVDYRGMSIDSREYGSTGSFAIQFLN